MTITRHTAADLFLLIIAAFICGLVISCVYEIIRSLPSFVYAYKHARFPKYKPFVHDMLTRDVGKATLVFADVVLCLLFAVGVLIVSFIFNSGNFRMSAPLAMILGYIAGACVFGKAIRYALLNILFILKWIFDIAMFPIIWLCEKFIGCFSSIYKKLLSIRNKRLIERYTAQRISQIDKTAEFGLIEEYYKELLK